MNNATETKKSYTDPISLASLMQILSGLNPYAVLYSDPYYGIDEYGASYFPVLEAKEFGRAGLTFNSVVKKEPVTVGEFLTFLREAVNDLGNEGHTVYLNYPVWLTFRLSGIRAFGGRNINGVIINGDGSYTLSLEELKPWK